MVTLTSVKDTGGTSNGGVDSTSLSVVSTVTVTAVNDAPVATAGGTLAYTENGSAVAIDNTIVLSDADDTQLTGATVTISSGFTSGDVLGFTTQNGITGSYNSGTGVLALSGTTSIANYQTALRSVTYSSSSDNPTASSTVTWAVTDAAGTGSNGAQTSTGVTSTVTVTAINDPPTLTVTASNPTYTENGAAAALFSSAAISAVEAADNIGQLVLTVSNLTDGAAEILSIDGSSVALTHGNSVTTATHSMTAGVSLSGNTATVTLSKAGGITVAQAQTLVNALAYSNSSDNPTVANRVVTLTSIKDTGGTANGGVDTTSLSVASTTIVTPVNDAPTITSGATYIFADTNEETASSGVTVNTLLTGAASWADPDGAGVAKGIAVTGTTGNGTWQYSTDSGAWTDFGTVSGTSALLLDGVTQVRYQPDLANGETASFIYKAWDETSGAASTNNIRQTANAGIGGGSSAFSSNSANGSITVTSVNDAPAGVDNLTLAAINEDTSNPTGTVISALTGYSFQDVDTGATTLGFLMVGNSANAATEGAWQYSSDSGANWKAIGAVADGATALALANTTQLRFVPAANFNGAPTALNIRVLDNTYNGAFSATARGNETRVTADSSANGGATAISGSVNTISTKGADQTVNEDAGVQTVNNWATGLSAGPADESGQTLNFTVNNDNNALFSLQPTIDSNGNLSYTPAANANGSATVTVSIKDSGGTANGGVDTSSGQTFTITVNSTTINLSQISGNTDGKQNPLISMVNTVRADNIAGAGINIDTDKNKIISDSLSTDYRNSTIDSFSSDNTGFSTKQAIVVYMELGVEASGNKTPGDTINMPFSVFAGLDTFGGVTITAELSTGQRLPPWISVDPITGAVTVKEGAVVTNLIIVKVTISDSRGNEVVVLVKVQPKQQQPDDTEKNQPPVKEKGQDQQSRAGHADKQPVYVSKPGLTQQLQMVGSKGFEMQRLKLLDSLASLVSNGKDAA